MDEKGHMLDVLILVRADKVKLNLCWNVNMK